MNLELHKSKLTFPESSVLITGSKSESNRLLLLRALFPEIEIENISISDDSMVMEKALNSQENLIDIHHAGTAMRFLTAYFAVQDGKEVVITGSSRMKERPIKVLVEALKDLGANIQYLENEGCPPLKIIGTTLNKNKVKLKADVSSQYISALLLIAPKLENGIQMTLEGQITSVPYIKMTLALLNSFGIETSFSDNIITVKPTTNLVNHKAIIESDWSSASYYYSIVALSDVGTSITLSSYKENSLQGDSVLSEIYQHFGVETIFINNSVTISKVKEEITDSLNIDLQSSPDIAQTISVTCFGLGIGCHLTGLHTLKIKETDRLLALKTELGKLGADVEISSNALILKPASAIRSNVCIKTYNDHRMAMAFAPLALKTTLNIEDAMVVSKSYPTFWEDLESIGFKISQ